MLYSMSVGSLVTNSVDPVVGHTAADDGAHFATEKPRLLRLTSLPFVRAAVGFYGHADKRQSREGFCVDWRCLQVASICADTLYSSLSGVIFEPLGLRHTGTPLPCQQAKRPRWFKPRPSGHRNLRPLSHNLSYFERSRQEATEVELEDEEDFLTSDRCTVASTVSGEQHCRRNCSGS